MNETDVRRDDLAAHNMERWNELASVGVAYSRPWLELTVESAREILDPLQVMTPVEGKRVLCLGSGGGQQSAAFALLGADVTILDLSTVQLERDRQAAEHYNISITIDHGDMRDLSRYDAASFDLVYHAFSINFVPDVSQVHCEVARILKPGRQYRMEWSNPFTQLVVEESWTGDGYLLNQTYNDGRDVTELLPHWDVETPDGDQKQIAGPLEYVHTLSTMVNSLVDNGFMLQRVSEYTGDRSNSTPGSWPHFCAIAAPYITIWSRYLPGLLST